MVFYSNTNRYLNKVFPQCYIQNEPEKQQYNERVLEIEKLTMEVLPVFYSQFMGLWEKNVSRFITD